MQIVASRDDDLIRTLRDLAEIEQDPRRHDLLALALEHA
jgi:hypothetical protein